ncbi:MAG: anti-sigma factor, partial [Acidobacteria bacterium]|nr:anti-sigma factor [Acidobacteriota bacterium]
EDAPQKKWLLYVRNLPPVPQDKVYERWFVPKTGNPVGVATFNTEGDGYYEVEIDLPAGVTGLKAAAVTTEPFPGVDQPTGSFALLGAGE